MELTRNQHEVMNAHGHLLVTGGPGSGKTTIAILKAQQIIEQGLHDWQRILFLSFARASVSRVVEAIEHERTVLPSQKQHIVVETYHSFFWRVLKTHGYLIGLPRRLTILTPPNVAIALADIRLNYLEENRRRKQTATKKEIEKAELVRVAVDEGRVCFDLFAPFVKSILQQSDRIRTLVSCKYPVIILDEFQDTNADQWQIVKALGNLCRLISLADPEQRIYEWIGADPERLDHFHDAFSPSVVDLFKDNHRSAGTEITKFGDDLLRGHFRQSNYRGIVFCPFDTLRNRAMSKLVTTTYGARHRLTNAENKDWSLAILVPTKKMTRLVSDALRNPPASMKAVPHRAVVELEAAILGAEIVAHLMQLSTSEQHLVELIDLICKFYQGKGGDEPTTTALREATNIRRAFNEYLTRKEKGQTIRRNSLLVNTLAVYKETQALEQTGNPDKDWRAVCSILENGRCKRLNEIAGEVRNIRLLDRGAQVRQTLSQDWKDHGGYVNALSVIRQVFLNESLATSTKEEKGIVVMNMHKAKGKQFDEVILFEGWPIRKSGKFVVNLDRIVRFNSNNNIDEQTRQNCRVSVTRAKTQTTILSPKCDPCVLYAEMFRLDRVATQINPSF